MMDHTLIQTLSYLPRRLGKKEEECSGLHRNISWVYFFERLTFPEGKAAIRVGPAEQNEGPVV